MIEVFNRLQTIFGRPVTLVDIDHDSLIFRLPWWASDTRPGGKEFEIGSWDSKVLERPTNGTRCHNSACVWIEGMLNGCVRNDAGELQPRRVLTGE